MARKPAKEGADGRRAGLQRCVSRQRGPSGGVAC